MAYLWSSASQEQKGHLANILQKAMAESHAFMFIYIVRRNDSLADDDKGDL